MSIDRRRARGLTLIELIVFIMIVSTALAGVLTALDVAARGSADPLIRKQALAIAEAVLEEVMLQSFTWCDPDDPQAATATSNAVGAGGCTAAGAVEAVGAETFGGGTDARGSATFPFDNASDYHGQAIATTLTGVALPVGYNAAVTVAEAALNGIAATESLLVTVTVTSPGETLQLQGYRTRHSPNLLP
ncbi:MAG: type II secretion system protein [Sterolibacteriaceae bacterium]|nr:type II secretion system protein [Sterolibacteriaceae bacterium]